MRAVQKEIHIERKCYREQKMGGSIFDFQEPAVRWNIAFEMRCPPPLELVSWHTEFSSISVETADFEFFDPGVGRSYALDATRLFVP